VALVPMQTNSMELIKASQFVATITGTAGWEAISVGKKALVFGSPWYLSLPGVYKFEDLNGLEDIVDSPGVDSNLLAQQVSSLLCKAAEGVVDPAYKVLVKNFDPHKNTQAVAGKGPGSGKTSMLSIRAIGGPLDTAAKNSSNLSPQAWISTSLPLF